MQLKKTRTLTPGVPPRHRDARNVGVFLTAVDGPAALSMCTPLRVALQRYSSSLRMALQERLFRSKAAAQPQPRLAASRPQYNGKCMLFRRARYGYSLRSAAAAPGPCDARRTALDTQASRLWPVHAVPTVRSAVLADGACAVTSANTRPLVGL